MNTPVVGFLTFSDFLAELKATPLSGEPVRVQDYHKQTPDKNFAPGEWLTFFVEAAIHVNSKSLVCRFITGHIHAYPRDEMDKINRYNRRNERAADILRARLQAEGFMTRPGLVAGAQEIKVQTSADGLWTREELEGEEGK